MRRFIVIGLFLFACVSGAIAGNVRIVEQPVIDPYNIKSNIAVIDMKVAWDNSWRDDYNWDAVYIFLKCKKQSDLSWSHVWLKNDTHELEGNQFTYWMANYPDGGTKDKATGIFVYRKQVSSGNSEVTLHLKWDITKNGYSKQDMINGVEYEAALIEMVYVPKGPFIPGDQYSKSCFQKNYRQILPEWDLISPSTKIMMESSSNSVATQYDPLNDFSVQNVCDRINDTHEAATAHVWKSEVAGNTSIIFDLGSKKRVRYVAVEGYSTKPTSWSLKGGTKLGSNIQFNALLGSFTKEDWMTGSKTCYPTTHAVALEKTGDYQYYMLELQTSSQIYIKNISMTDKDLATLTDDAYVIDGAANMITYNEILGLTVKDGTISTTTPLTAAPVGYEGFYAMKYEISQAQYIGFLNKLLYRQQKLRTVGDRLDNLEVGDYVYSQNKKKPSFRNGIVVGVKQDGRYIFASNLDVTDGKMNGPKDGQNIACNNLSPADMLAYASWVGLRPLSEFEYEKMARQGYDLATGKIMPPVQGEYAWGTKMVSPPDGDYFNAAGTATEKLVDANVNVLDMASGPARVGSFAMSANSREQSGGGFSGAMELSGNLAEIYYSSLPNKKYLYQTLNAHGMGVLTDAGDMEDRLSSYWGSLTAAAFPSYFIPRGGSFQSEAERARISDRSLENYFTSVNQKDSTMTFRLGHSVTSYQSTSDPDYYPFSYLKTESGQTTENGTISESICTGNGYTIIGSSLLVGKGTTVGAELSGPVSYVWYTKTEEGDWMMMRGKNQKDLKLEISDLQNKSSVVRVLSFKRRAYTPTQFSETGIVNLSLENVDAFSHDAEEILKANNQIDGVLVETRASAKFEWSAELGGKIKVLPANYITATSSYMSITRDSFPQAGKGYLYCDVTTNANQCKKRMTFPLTVEARPTTGIPTGTMTFANCGQFVKDTRDQEVYGTVKVGNQCWMAENMRYKGEDLKNNFTYSTLDPKGSVYGLEYYARNTYSELVCPEGWRLPRDNDFKNLVSYLDQGDEKVGVRLRAGNYWRVGNRARGDYQVYIYGKAWADAENPTGHAGGDFNASGMGFMGGGYGTSSDVKTAVYLMTWRSSTWQNGWRMGYNDNTFSSWSSSSYYLPIRCILTTTSVD